jgi:tetratricopeptide (TPR) repeat protein
LDVEERSYQTGLSLDANVEGLTGQANLYISLLRGRALSGIARFDDARAAYGRVLDECAELQPLDAYVRVLIAENDLSAGDIADAREHAEEAYARTRGSKDYFLRLRSCCVLAECAIHDGSDALGFKRRLETVENEMLASRWVARVASGADQAKLVRQLFGRHGSLHQYFVRVDTLSRRGDQLEETTGWDPEAVAVAMAIAGWSDDLVELLLTEARIAANAGEQAVRMRLAGRALMELDGTRYRLAAQSSRTSWSRRFQRALAVALDAAHCEQDHAFVAELLEFARVQGLPAATAEASGDLALSTPPVVQLRGLSRLARPGEDRQREPVALEAAAERAAGVGGWWLSFWETSEWLYWALIPPGDSEIGSGRIRIDGQSDLRRDLALLQDSLPLVRPDEDLPTADFRIARSPLLNDPSAEQKLSARLGLHLLPTALLAAARECALEGRRLPLAIAPSPSLGYVPWGLLAAPRAGGGYDRLLNLCDWVVAPSAALVVQAPGGNSVQRTPLALAIADTTAAPSLGALGGARSQAAALPPSVTVLGGRHWTRDVATIAAFEARLRDLGPDITVAFLCHAIRGTRDEPSRGGLVMAAPVSGCSDGKDRLVNDDFAILSAASIFAMTARAIAMPAQVLLQACDTSALSDGASGEWLTLAPAFVAGGSREVVATLYPTPDISSVDDPVIQAALNGTSLREAVTLTQRVGLSRWEAGDATNATHTPMYWAGYATICVDAASGDGAELGAGTSDVSARFVKVLAKAIKESREGRGKRLDSGFLLSAVLDEGGIAELFDGGSHTLKPSAFVWTLGPYLCSRFLRLRDGATRDLVLDDSLTIEVSETLSEAFATACRMALRDGVLVEPEHFLQATLARRSAARRILGFLSKLTGRHFELTQRAVAHVLAETISRGQKFPSEVTDHSSTHERFAHAFVERSVATASAARAGTPAAPQPPLSASLDTASAAGAAADVAEDDHEESAAEIAIAPADVGKLTLPPEPEAALAVMRSPQFERFADDATDVVKDAIETARSLEHDHVGTGHLLIGLLGDGRTIASQALAGVGVDLESVRRCVTRQVPAAETTVVTPLPFSHSAKETLQLALRESLAAQAARVSGEHILVALARQEDSLACRIMRELGATPSAVEVAVEKSRVSAAST